MSLFPYPLKQTDLPYPPQYQEKNMPNMPGKLCILRRRLRSLKNPKSGSVIPIFANLLMAINFDLDGLRCAERWWSA